MIRLCRKYSALSLPPTTASRLPRPGSVQNKGLTAFADAAAPGIVLAQAVGRLGNWFNQELYGAPTTLSWGLEIYRRVDPATGAPDNLGGVALDRTPVEIVQPTFLYELVWNIVVAVLVVVLDRRLRLSRGRAFAVYVAGYTAGRFVIELLRTDPATRVFGDVRINVVVAAVVFVAAVIYLVAVRGPREDLSASMAGAEPGSTPETSGTPDDVDEHRHAGPETDDRRGPDDAADAREKRREAAGSGHEVDHGSAEPSGVDAEPEGTAPEEEAAAEPPSAAR